MYTLFSFGVNVSKSEKENGYMKITRLGITFIAANKFLLAIDGHEFNV